MNLKLGTLTENVAKEICSWRYSNEYSIYNYPSWNKIAAEKWAITIEEKRKKEFNTLLDGSNNLCGYIRLVNKDNYILLGLGLKPDLCGQDLGNDAMNLIIEHCRNKYNDKKIILEVRSFNKRAIKCYEKAGFHVIDTYKKNTPIGYGVFLKMEFTI